MKFEKEFGNLINKDEIYQNELVKNNEEVKNIINDIIKKCKDNKYYQIDNLNMNYVSNSYSN